MDAVARTAFKRLLVVDDDGDTRDLLSLALRKNGYDVVTAAGGREAQELIRGACPDAILIDLMMPGMDGIIFLRWLRSEMKIDVPVVVFSSVKMETFVQAASDMGTVTFVRKPAQVPVLLETLRALETQEQPRGPGAVGASRT